MKCLVPGCRSTVSSARFHYFPVNNVDLCRTWLRCVRSPEFGEEIELQVISQERLMVCSDHFRLGDYHRNFLKGDAVPSVFPWSEGGEDPRGEHTQGRSERKDASPTFGFPAEEEPQPDVEDERAKAPQESRVLTSGEVLVNMRCLLELFRFCSACLIECSVSVEGHERLFSVTQDCQSCGFHREWRSRPAPGDRHAEAEQDEHDDAYVKVEDTGVTGIDTVPVVTRISPLNRRGKGKTPQAVPAVGPSADADVQEPAERRPRTNGLPQRQGAADFDISDVPVDEDLFHALKSDVELGLVVWCTTCSGDASAPCLQLRHKKVFGCARCSDAQDEEKRGLERLTVHYDDLGGFSSHAQAEHGATPLHKLCPECSTFVLADPRSRGAREHRCEPQTQHVCPECGNLFLTEAALKSHYDQWHVVLERPCKYCMGVFGDRRSRLRHERTHLKEEKPFSCPKCEERFESLRKRKSHLRSHEVRVKHKCEICRKLFVSLIRLMKHKVVHFGEDPSKYELKPRRRSKDIPLKIKRSVVDLRNQKKSIREIAKAMGISRSTVGNIIRRHVQTGDVLSKKRSGRPKKTNTEDDQIFVSIMTKNPKMSILQIRQKLMEVGKEMSASTIRRKLHSLNHVIESTYLDNLRVKK